MKKLLMALALTAAAGTLSTDTRAADHLDVPSTTADPTADITDTYAWMSTDATKVNLILNVFAAAGADATFSTEVVYTFRINSSSGYGQPQTETQVLCQFYDTSKIECWAAGEYVEGDPSAEAGIASTTGKLRVFAGLRNDPFFMELAGFGATVAAVTEAAPDLAFDDEGCPRIDEATSAALVGQLQSGPNGEPASDTLAGSNVLALVVQIDKNLVNPGGQFLGVWASTHASNG